MEIRNKIIFLLIIILFAGCSSNTDLKNIETLLDIFKETLNFNDKPLKTFSKKEIESIPYPIKEVRTDGYIKQVLMLPITQRSGFSNYSSGQGQTITFQGIIVTKTNGFNVGLVSLEVSGLKKLENIIKEKKQKNFFKTYKFLRSDTSLIQLTFDCSLEVLKSEKLIILDEIFNTSVVREICSNKKDQFSNYYWINNNDEIIKSLQWISPSGIFSEITVLKK